MANYIIISYAINDNFGEHTSLADAKKALRDMQTDPEMAQYFPMAIEFEAPRSPYMPHSRVHTYATTEETIRFGVKKAPYATLLGDGPGHPGFLTLVQALDELKG